VGNSLSGRLKKPVAIDLDPQEHGLAALFAKFMVIINVRCKCAREVHIAPIGSIGQHGVQKYTKVWSLRDRFRCTKCTRRPPALFWMAK
jgi:hypothetical protein